MAPMVLCFTSAPPPASGSLPIVANLQPARPRPREMEAPTAAWCLSKLTALDHRWLPGPWHRGHCNVPAVLQIPRRFRQRSMETFCLVRAPASMPLRTAIGAFYSFRIAVLRPPQVGAVADSSCRQDFSTSIPAMAAHAEQTPVACLCRAAPAHTHMRWETLW